MRVLEQRLRCAQDAVKLSHADALDARYKRETERSAGEMLLSPCMLLLLLLLYVYSRYIYVSDTSDQCMLFLLLLLYVYDTSVSVHAAPPLAAG
jgi:hypothetical protein